MRRDTWKYIKEWLQQILTLLQVYDSTYHRVTQTRRVTLTRSGYRMALKSSATRLSYHWLWLASGLRGALTCQVLWPALSLSLALTDWCILKGIAHSVDILAFNPWQFPLFSRPNWPIYGAWAWGLPHIVWVNTGPNQSLIVIIKCYTVHLSWLVGLK